MQPKITISVALMEDGQVAINGPIQDKVTCLGLLDIARHMIITHNPAKQPGILIPRGPVRIDQAAVVPRAG